MKSMCRIKKNLLAGVLVVSLAHDTHVAVAAYQLLVDTSVLLESIKRTQVHLVFHTEFSVESRKYFSVSP